MRYWKLIPLKEKSAFITTNNAIIHFAWPHITDTWLVTWPTQFFNPIYTSKNQPPHGHLPIYTSHTRVYPRVIHTSPSRHYKPPTKRPITHTYNTAKSSSASSVENRITHYSLRVYTHTYPSLKTVHTALFPPVVVGVVASTCAISIAAVAIHLTACLSLSFRLASFPRALAGELNSRADRLIGRRHWRRGRRRSTSSSSRRMIPRCGAIDARRSSGAINKWRRGARLPIYTRLHSACDLSPSLSRAGRSLARGMLYSCGTALSCLFPGEGRKDVPRVKCYFLRV